MTEKCQTKVVEKNNNQNFIIYSGIGVTLFAVLYFYRFHFVTIIFSYVLGCLACYYGLNLRLFNIFLEQFICHLIRKPPQKHEQKSFVKSCNTCGSRGCDRHDPELSAEPWSGLQIHKQLDQAIEDLWLELFSWQILTDLETMRLLMDKYCFVCWMIFFSFILKKIIRLKLVKGLYEFFNTVLEQFINTWYSKITQQPFFVDELRHQLRYASASLLRRALKINYARLIIDRLVPCGLRHCTLNMDCVRPIHVAASGRDAELRYLRCLTEVLLPHVLRPAELQNSVFRVLVREIFAGWVLLPLTDTLADPHILNTLIVLATNDERMEPLPVSPNYEVEILENFVRQTDSVYGQRARLLRIDLELLISNQDHFYAFMQHLKTGNNIYLLQFYKDIKLFQSRILNPDLSLEEQKILYSEAKRLFENYMVADVPRVHLPEAMLQELRELLEAGPDCVKRLQTSRALYQAARQSHSALEKIMLPKFLHSEEFYKLFLGERIPVGFQKQMAKRPQDKVNLLKMGFRLKNALKPHVVDGQVLETMEVEEQDSDAIDNMDILKYLDSLAAEDSMGEHDLSTYKVVLTNVESRMQAAPRRGYIRVFTLSVHRLGARGAEMWGALRSENDFHLLRSKLLEFHGEELLADLPLPSRRDNSPLETLRYKYEDFLQRILKIRLLQTSELLYSFLTVDGDFSIAVQASTLNVTSSDLGNIYQSVAHKLRKEKGQHLESFLRNFLISSDKERYQALKHGTAREVEEAQEVNEEVIERQRRTPEQNARNIHDTIFKNNFDIEPVVLDIDKDYQNTIVGFTQCFMYILIKVVKAPALLSSVVGGVLCAASPLVDATFNSMLGGALRGLLCERRLAHLIRLGHGLLFGKIDADPPMEDVNLRDRALYQLITAVPVPLHVVLGSGLQRSLVDIHRILQNPVLNKQLVYNLLDLCVMELFPELRNKEVVGTSS